MENNIKAGAFVIPNGSAVANDFLIESFRERTIKEMTDICRQFSQDYDPDKDKLIQLWFHSDYEDGENKDERRLGSDNLSCHGFRIDGRHYYFDYDYLPYKILKDVKEGDILTIEFDCERDSEEDERIAVNNEVEKVPLVMDVKFEQLPYRYRNKGRFEEAVRYVL